MDTSNAENIAEVVAGPEAPSEVSLASVSRLDVDFQST